MVPQFDLVRVQRWVDARNERIPDSARDLIRNDIDVTDRSITIVECRPPWNPDLGPEWTRSPVARLRYTRMSSEWSLYWIDRNSKSDEYHLIDPSTNVDVLLAEVDRDPTAIFWG